MSFCSNCGKELMDGAAFCEECGTPVEQPRGAAATADGTGLSSVQNLPFHIIGGAVFVVVALIDLYWSLRYGFVGWMFIVALLDIAFAVALFARIKKPVIQIAMGIEILVQLWRIIRALSYGWYSFLFFSTKYILTLQRLLHTCIRIVQLIQVTIGPLVIQTEIVCLFLFIHFSTVFLQQFLIRQREQTDHRRQHVLAPLAGKVPLRQAGAQRLVAVKAAPGVLKELRRSAHNYLKIRRTTLTGVVEH